MTNCVMMNVDWRELTWWQYQALLSVWNDRHSDRPDEPPPIDAARIKAAMAAVH